MMPLVFGNNGAAGNGWEVMVMVIVVMMVMIVGLGDGGGNGKGINSKLN